MNLPSVDHADRLLHLSRQMLQELVSRVELDSQHRLGEKAQREQFDTEARQWLLQHGSALSVRDRELVVKMMMDEIFGLGPLEVLLHDSTISDILVNGPRQIYVERSGQLEQESALFENEEHLLQVTQRFVNRLGKLLDESHPMVDARLPDGSRFNAIIPPLSRRGTCISIRRFPKSLSIHDLLQNESLSTPMGEFLAAAVFARLNVLVSGGTGSGKTTLLNVLSNFIPEHERVITIEDAAELQLFQPHVLPLETRPPNIEGRGEVTQRDLVRNALRMRPDRIIIGECRGGEAFDMLQAMNTGHDGSLTTVHANNTQDALTRVEMLVEMAGLEIPLSTIRRQLAAAIQLLVHIARLQGGVRRILKISEISSFDGDNIILNDLFTFNQTGVDSTGKAVGKFAPTGNLPVHLPRFQAAGLELPPNLFQPTINPEN